VAVAVALFTLLLPTAFLTLRGSSDRFGDVDGARGCCAVNDKLLLVMLDDGDSCGSVPAAAAGVSKSRCGDTVDDVDVDSDVDGVDGGDSDRLASGYGEYLDKIWAASEREYLASIGGR
jgi:hypothetical protein